MIIIQIFQFILALSILIVLHEAGHFIPARLFKMRVEKFYLFFNPWFSLFKFKRGETEYGVGWLPLGGYVKISGMMDESMDKEQMAKDPEPWEFRSKPAWQRLIVMVGGVTVNLILGAVIYAMVLFTWGEKFISSENAKYGISVAEEAGDWGLENGDIILAVGDNDIRKVNFGELNGLFLPDEPSNVTVLRNGQEQKIDLNMDSYANIKKTMMGGKRIIGLRYPFIIDSVFADKPALAAGIKKGDRLISVNGESSEYYDEIAQSFDTLKAKEVELGILRGSDTVLATLTLTENGKIGVGLRSIDKLFDFETKEYGFLESIPAGTVKAKEKLVQYVSSLGLLFDKDAEGYKHIGGFISIGSIFSPTWDWEQFWVMTALLSIILAFMNLLPIPALDGGHVMFLLYEIISGRKPNEKVMEIAQVVGMILIFGLLILANGNDIARFF